MVLRRIARRIVQHWRKRGLCDCGSDVDIQASCTLIGNIHIGNHVLVGRGGNFVSSRADLYIHDYVVFGPDVTIYTGDHATDIVGLHICEITDEMKNISGKRYDKDVCIQSGCWIGTRAIILKGVTIGCGSVIGAGAVVTKDVPPYSIYTGVGSASTIRRRFTDDEIVQHEEKIKKDGKPIR